MIHHIDLLTGLERQDCASLSSPGEYDYDKIFAKNEG